MNKNHLLLFFVLVVVAQSIDPNPKLKQEKRLINIRQLTFSGENAEAYFSLDGKQLVFQAKPGKAKLSQAKPSQAKPRQAKPSNARPSQAKQGQAKPSQARPGQAKPS